MSLPPSSSGGSHLRVSAILPDTTSKLLTSPWRDCWGACCAVGPWAVAFGVDGGDSQRVFGAFGEVADGG